MNSPLSPQPRLPFMVWGDLRSGGSPVLRRKLVGWRAHECMYAWVYLTDYLAVRKIEEIWESDVREIDGDPFFPTLDGPLWERHDRSRVDPHFQINAGSFETAAVGTSILSAVGEGAATVSELGSTFFTAIDKYRLAAKELTRLDPSYARSDPDWFGIDNSPFVNDVAQIFHVLGEAPTILDDYRKVRKLDGYGLFMSRFVSSYVFRTTAEFAEFLLSNYDGAIVEDAFLAAGGEAEVFNHGQRETYLDLSDLCRRLGGGGRRVFLLDHYPDFPAGTQPCFVCKLVVLDDKTDPDVVAERCRKLGYVFDPASQEVDPDSVIAGLSAGTSSERWAQVQRYKAVEPVWGRTPEEPPEVPFKSRMMNGLYRLRQSLRVWQKGWRRLNTRHPLTFMDVQHALEDKRNE